MVKSSMLIVPCCVVCMRTYLFMISYADTVRENVSRFGCWIQVLAALNPMDPLHNCDVCEQSNMLAKFLRFKIFCRGVLGDPRSWKHNHKFPVAEDAGKILKSTFCQAYYTFLFIQASKAE